MILLLLLPLFLILSVVRLYQLPIQLKSGAIRFRRKSWGAWTLSVLTGIAYSVLLASTLIVLFGIPSAFFLATSGHIAGVPIVVAGTLFPLLYLSTELLIYWSVEIVPNERNRIGIDRSSCGAAINSALAQFKAGGIPYATCPSCEKALIVERATSQNKLGSLIVRCNCGMCDTSAPI
jgi:hypothetical protein